MLVGRKQLVTYSDFENVSEETIPIMFIKRFITNEQFDGRRDQYLKKKTLR